MRTFTPLEFLAQASVHITNKWEQTTRWLGAYSSQTRGAAKRAADDAAQANAAPTFDISPSDILAEQEPQTRSKANWARLMKKFYEIDPLICPKCGSNMKLMAFFTDPIQIDRICANLKISTGRAPPKLRYSIPMAA